MQIGKVKIYEFRAKQTSSTP